MAIKLLSEGFAAWVAIGITTAGGIVTTAIHYGETQNQISTLQQRQDAAAAQLARHDAALSAIEAQNAANAQALADIKDAVHDIQQQVHHDRH